MKTKIYVYAGLFIALIIGIITIGVLNDKEISIV